MAAVVSLGVAAALGPPAIARIARAAEEAGFAALWVNDTPDADALAALRAAARVTATLGLATGVLPVDRRTPVGIAAEVADLPAERVTLGIGSGATRAHPVDAVAEALEVLQSRSTARIMVGALGPRMRRLAAARSAGPLLSWLSPTIAGAQAAEAYGLRDSAHVALYVRTALDEAAVPRLRDETARYASFPNYAANFARLGLAPADTVLAPATATSGLVAYRDAVDEVVLRAITPGDGLSAYDRFVAAAAPLLAAR